MASILHFQRESKADNSLPSACVALSRTVNRSNHSNVRSTHSAKRRWNPHAWRASTWTIDEHLRVEEATVEDYDAVYVPGGAWDPDQLRANPAVLSFLQKFKATGKPLGALCHGSQVFISAKLTKGRKARGYYQRRRQQAHGPTLCPRICHVFRNRLQVGYLSTPQTGYCNQRGADLAVSEAGKFGRAHAANLIGCRPNILLASPIWSRESVPKYVCASK